MTYPLPSPLMDALTNGPGMLVFYLLLAAWLAAFITHLLRLEVRRVTRLATFTLALLIGLLAPMIYFLGARQATALIFAGGAIDPVQYSGIYYVAATSSLIVGGVGAITLIMSAWAWLLPCPGDDREGPPITR